MKIFAVSDVHGDSRQMQKLAKRARDEKVDLVVFCGDIIGLVETRNLISPFAELKKPILLVPGNWDSPSAVDALAKIYNLRNPNKEKIEKLTRKWSPYRTWACRILWGYLDIK